MQASRQLKDEISINSQLKLMTQAYQEHAITQINLARYSVVSSRAFMEELSEVFSNVKTSYEIYLKAIGKKGQKKLQEKLEKNGREVLILLSANGKFYGDLVTKVGRTFIEAAKTKDADLVIVGTEGKKLFEESRINKPFDFFQIPDTSITIEMLRPLIVKIIQYKKATIFYGRFDNIITQEPTSGSLTGDMPKAQEKKGETNFIFEPSVENIMEFFESQIFSMLLNQTVSEGKLARFASRIKAMEFAQNNLEKQLEQLIGTQRRLKSMTINKKQIQLFAGQALWGNK